MLREVGSCQGIENYSRHLTGGVPGEPPPTLLDYLPDDCLLVVDESHQTMPQVRGMYEGDRSRKQTLVDYGFRLPSALDNRPLKFDEFDAKVGQRIYVSATPAPWELGRTTGVFVEQVIRPTGLLDPVIELRPAQSQVDDLLAEAQTVVARGERVLVTTLTKRMAEELTQYLRELGLKVRYLHSDIETLERVQITTALRKRRVRRPGRNQPAARGPRPTRGVAGRRARRRQGRVPAQRDLADPDRRPRRAQPQRPGPLLRRPRHRLDPPHPGRDRAAPYQAGRLQPGARRSSRASILKEIHNPLVQMSNLDYHDARAGRLLEVAEVTAGAFGESIRSLEKQMRAAAKRLEFEQAAALRDRIKELRELHDRRGVGRTIQTVSVDSHVAERIRELPDRPGIYIFKDAEGKPLYVGKAKSLRKRAANYLSGDHDAAPARRWSRRRATSSSWSTDTEAEALLLENNWIKQRQAALQHPAARRQDLSLSQAHLHDEYPRIAFTRRIRGRRRRVLRAVPARRSGAQGDQAGAEALPGAGLPTSRSTASCRGPVSTTTCTAAWVPASPGSPPRRRTPRRSSRRGSSSPGATRSCSSGSSAADVGGRRAPGVRARRRSCATPWSRSSRSASAASSPRSQGEDVDVYGVHVAGGNAAVAVLVMRGGQVLDRRELFWEGEPGLDRARLLSELLPQIYDRTTFIPKEIHLPMPIEGEEALLDWLSERKGERVYLRLPSRGAKAERVALAMHNAELAHRRRFRGASAHPGAVERLRRHLELDEPPRRIEGFDISPLPGRRDGGLAGGVGRGARCARGDYRTFNMRGLAGPDDFASMRQAVERALPPPRSRRSARCPT